MEDLRKFSDAIVSNRVVPDIRLAGYPAFFDIRYPVGYPVSVAGYPAGYLAGRITGYPARNTI